ncbi:MAG: hypothetical protein AAGH40_05015 [Verrucomicrobiota bacterium]
MLRPIILFFLMALGALTLTGCFNSDVDEQSVPWSRPADWERNAPGFGG